MADNYLSRLVGTLQNKFRVGSTAGITLKNNSGTAQIRTGTDSAHADLESKTIKLLGANASNGVTISVPSGLGANATFVFPGADGSTGQVLKTDGAGTLYFANNASGANETVISSFTQASSSPMTLLAPSANARLLEMRINITSAAGGGSPTVSIGTAGTPNLYVLTGESDLKIAGEYIIPMFVDVGGSPADIILTITVSGQTFSGTVSITYKV